MSQPGRALARRRLTIPIAVATCSALASLLPLLFSESARANSSDLVSSTEQPETSACDEALGDLMEPPTAALTLTLAEKQESRKKLVLKKSEVRSPFVLELTQGAGYALTRNRRVPAAITGISGTDLEASDFIRVKAAVVSPNTIQVTICARDGLIESGIVSGFVVSDMPDVHWQSFHFEVVKESDSLVRKLGPALAGMIAALAVTVLVRILSEPVTAAQTESSSTFVSSTGSGAPPQYRYWGKYPARSIASATLLVFALGAAAGRAYLTISGAELWFGDADQMIDVFLVSATTTLAVAQISSTISVANGRWHSLAGTLKFWGAA